MTDYPMQCGHSITFNIPPKPGDDLWCLKCDAPTRVLRSARKPKNMRSALRHAEDYKTYCHECGSTLYTGKRSDAESDATLFRRADKYASGHAWRKYHTVELWAPDGSHVKTARRDVPGQLPLFVTDGDGK